MSTLNIDFFVYFESTDTLVEMVQALPGKSGKSKVPAAIK